MGSAKDREIVAAEVIVTCPARNFVTLKIVTRSGVTGLGDATLNGRELAVASYLKDHLVPNLIGRDGRGEARPSAARRVSRWWFLDRPRESVPTLPLYQLLGGRSREGVLEYG